MKSIDLTISHADGRIEERRLDIDRLFTVGDLKEHFERIYGIRNISIYAYRQLDDDIPLRNLIESRERIKVAVGHGHDRVISPSKLKIYERDGTRSSWGSPRTTTTYGRDGARSPGQTWSSPQSYRSDRSYKNSTWANGSSYRSPRDSGRYDNVLSSPNGSRRFYLTDTSRR